MWSQVLWDKLILSFFQLLNNFSPGAISTLYYVLYLSLKAENIIPSPLWGVLVLERGTIFLWLLAQEFRTKGYFEIEMLIFPCGKKVKSSLKETRYIWYIRWHYKMAGNIKILYILYCITSISKGKAEKEN